MFVFDLAPGCMSLEAFAFVYIALLDYVAMVLGL